MGELVRHDVRLEHARIVKDRDIAREDVCRAQRERKEKLHEREVADLGARFDSLPRDARDVVREVAIRHDGQLLQRDALRCPALVDAAGQFGDLGLAGIRRHCAQVVDVGAELGEEVDLADAESLDPVLY